MNEKSNRSMCVSHMGGNLMVRLYWDVQGDGAGKKEHEAGLDVSNFKNVRKAQSYLAFFRDLICGVALSADGLFVVYNFDNATPEQVKIFDATVSQKPLRMEGSTMRGAGYKSAKERALVNAIDWGK